jgi:hypothetical protein
MASHRKTERKLGERELSSHGSAAIVSRVARHEALSTNKNGGRSRREARNHEATLSCVCG